MNESIENVQIIVTGERFVGGGIRSIESVMTELVRSAKNEIHIAVFLLTSPSLVELLFEAASRGVKVVLVLDRLDSNPRMIIERLERIASTFPHFIVKDFSSNKEYKLHSKVIVCDRSAAIVGSANLSGAGLHKNHEIALYVRGDIAREIACLVERL